MENLTERMPYELDETDEQLLAALVDGARTPGWLLENLDLPMSTRSAVQQRLKLLSASGKVENIGKGLYELVDEDAAPNQSDYRAKALAAKGSECSICGETDNVVVHHRDGHRGNNVLENLVVLCEQHHADVHAKRDTVPDLVRELGYEPRSGETTTIEIGPDTWRFLNAKKQPGDSFDDVLQRELGIGSSDSGTGQDRPPRVDVPDSLPGQVDESDAAAAIDAALRLIAEDPAEFSTIAEEVGRAHPLGYGADQVELRDGAWWSRVVKPGIKANGAEHQPGRGWTAEV